MEKEMTQIDKAELIRLRGVDEMYKMHVAKLGRKAKELDERCLQIIKDNSGKVSISKLYDMCKVEGMGRTAFRKIVISMDVRELYHSGKRPEEIVEALKLKRKHSKMTKDKVIKMLELMGHNINKEVISTKSSEDIRDMASRIVRWTKGSQPTDVVMDELGFYRVLLLSQPDDSVVYIPFEILKQLSYRIEHIVDRNMDMTKFVAICTMRVDKVDIITLGTFDETSHMVRLQIVKSSRPQSDKIYDIQHIKENYIRITLRVVQERI